MTTASRRSLPALAGWVALSLMAGAVGGIATRPGAWYAGLAKPAWTPPAWLFGPVWTALYVAMGVAAWLVWQRRGHPDRGRALALFAGQLALNALWSWLFFAWHRLDLASLEIALLWAAILATLLAFRRVRPAAAALLAPYLLWVTFAAVLTVTIWRMNGTTG